MSINANVVAALVESPLWFLATCDNGEPNVVPVGFKWIEGDRLLIADLFFGKTRANLGRRPRVAIATGLLNPKRGIQVKGTATVHRSGAVFDRVCELLKAAGVDAAPWSAIEVPFEEVYSLDPGPGAGKRIA